MILPRRRLLVGAGASLLAAPSIVRAGTIPLLQAGKAPGGGGGGGATIWDSGNKTANMVLSGTPLTVATATGADSQGVRSVATVVTNQKVYLEFVPSVNANNQQLGFGTASHILSAVPGGDGISFSVDYTGVYRDSGSSDNLATMPSWTTGDRVGIAYNDATKRFWLRVNNAAWSNSGDPAAGTGGRIVSVTGTLFAVLYIAFDTEFTTARFASTAWVDTAPSGYTQLA